LTNGQYAGIDNHTKVYVDRIIKSVVGKGAGVLSLSYEIDEFRLLADRVLTLYYGLVVGHFGPPNLTGRKCQPN